MLSSVTAVVPGYLVLKLANVTHLSDRFSHPHSMPTATWFVPDVVLQQKWKFILLNGTFAHPHLLVDTRDVMHSSWTDQNRAIQERSFVQQRLGN